MGVAELKKAELYYHRSVQEDVAKTLQHSGSCQIIETSGTTEPAADVAERLTLCEEQHTHLRYLFRSIGGHYTDPVSSIDRMLGEKPVLSMTELAQAADKTDLKTLAASVRKMETQLNALRLEASQLKTNASILSLLRDFPYPLSVLGDGTKTLKGLFAVFPADALEAFRASVAAQLSAETELFISPGASGDREVRVVVLYLRTHEPQVLDLCAQSGASPVELPSGVRDVVSAELSAIAGRVAELERREADLQEDLKRTANEWMPTLQRLFDYWNILSGRYGALASSDATDRTFRTSFWVPTTALPHLQKRLEAISPNVALVVSDPGPEDEPPTLLKNHPLARPAEVLTNLYSPPPYGEVDPTPFVAPFFFIFFGMCLGDAGYALVMGAGIWMLFRKYRRIPFSVGNFLNLFAMGAVMTFIYGAITGSFFGDFIDVVFFMAPLRPLKNALFILDPMGKPMVVLGISLLLGVIHLMFGLAVAAWDAYRKGNIVDAVGDKACWILFVTGLILVGTSSALPFVFLPGLCMALVGGCIIFWYAGRGTKNIFLKIGSGLYALYGSTSYLGDILSYSRLLALGLGSAVIGSIINLLGTMAVGVPYIGWVLAGAIVIGGHVFGIAVNLLGAFVHSMRLQYVEFFSKFYSGGGSIFRPLTLSTQYVDVIDPESGFSS
ncbi:MAG: V-type ATP synthase subunit I [Synergistaceae bacterium]|jgi:V/A-type H+-transporting ATPase subunit I|nr:V-type ATP synthase subunit I [Synergistaceae bacterium]